MLISKCTHVNLKKTYRKILYLYQAYNETFVFLGSMGPRKDFLAHVDKAGKELFYHEFGSPIDTLGMINEYQAVILQTRSNCISILDLKRYQFKRLLHYFLSHQSDQCYLFTFPDTKYMTVVEYGRYNDNRLKLTYYNYPRKNPIHVENNKPLMYHRKELFERQYESQEDQWTYEYQVVKGNNHSMIIWYKARHDETFEFKFFKQGRNYMPLHQYNTTSNNGWQYKCIRINHNFQQLYNFRGFNLSVNEVMQIQQDKLMICCLSNRDKADKQGQVIKNTYIVDVGTSVIGESLHDLGRLHAYQIDVRMIGNGHMIRTFQYRYGVSVASPVYYFSNSSFEMICQQQWVCSYRTKYTFPGYDSFVMLENEYQNNNVKQFKCYYRKLVEFRQIMLFLMLEMNQDFDQDLLNDVIVLTAE